MLIGPAVPTAEPSRHKAAAGKDWPAALDLITCQELTVHAEAVLEPNVLKEGKTPSAEIGDPVKML